MAKQVDIELTTSKITIISIVIVALVLIAIAVKSAGLAPGSNGADQSS